jgi:hypothetical protein
MNNALPYDPDHRTVPILLTKGDSIVQNRHKGMTFHPNGPAYHYIRQSAIYAR